MSRRTALTCATALMAVFMLSACGTETASQEQQTAEVKLIIKASNYKFDQTEYRVKGNQPIQFSLETNGNHGITIDELDLSLDPINHDQVITPAAGTYTFECNIACGPGHKDMKATLIVE
ncbi:cupredoxin domain-containing protein [Paenibacillus sp. SC116]|uniref:cupredoxin domain-containing protein n=1 Tax=Paenibacillus sp. SC116 TaxID=2968986 RepID=UPI00215A6BF2|nr:cupredoxin domain-containing protein [Paenibacillus sp. SC116]MCR8843822.1 cupredoxin domain-containing protein [Paenibacillus sp. SC116]